MAISFSEFFGIIGILVSVLLIVFLLARYFGIIIETENSRKMKRYQPQVFKSIAVGNPFSLDLEVEKNAFGDGPIQTKNDKIRVKIHTQLSCRVQCFWNVHLSKALSIATGHAKENREDRSTSNDVSLDIIDLLMQYSSEYGNKQILNPTLEAGETFEFQPGYSDTVTHDNLHTKLVVAIKLIDETSERNLLDEDIVCLCTAIDTKCSRTNAEVDHFVSQQFIQTAGKKIHTLKALYSSGIPDADADDNGDLITATDELCIICHSLPVTRALLPCRHACICGVCFRRTILCPICRSKVTSFLITNDESRLPEPPQDEADLVEQTSNRLNDMSVGQLVRAIWNAS